MSRIAKIRWNDTSNGKGVCVSLFVQGCPHRCEGCFNPETWDFNGGIKPPYDIKGQIVKGISEGDVLRNFNVLGGEPLCEENLEFVDDIITAVRIAYPHIKIYLWTGYLYEDLVQREDKYTKDILDKIDILIDGPFKIEERDITLELRGSKNQRIIKLKS